MPERTTVRLEPGLLRAVKKKAAEEGRTLTSLVEEGLNLLIHRKTPKAAPPGKYVLPVSKAKGGPRAGIDLTRTSDLLELLDEDLPMIKRR